jgi:hypothetical protein
MEVASKGQVAIPESPRGILRLKRHQQEALKAFNDFSALLQTRCAAEDVTFEATAQQHGTATLNCMQCWFNFWHVLDIRFQHLPHEKARADVLLCWFNESQTWQNKKGTVVMTSQELATFCLESIQARSGEHDCTFASDVLTHRA